MRANHIQVFKPDTTIAVIFEKALKGLSDSDLEAICAKVRGKKTKRWAVGVLRSKRKRAWADAPQYRKRHTTGLYVWEYTHTNGTHRVSALKEA